MKHTLLALSILAFVVPALAADPPAADVPVTKIVLFSSESKEQLAERARRAGADGYIPMTQDSERFLSQVEAYLTNEAAPSPPAC